ncbi:uncharacterized protein SKDI_05G1630 [Saccharomyces kudriavzevii IFO 1802]|uniref:YER085C-like protein n=2 Tax=Saccharomyces kudriavzevii (strain ATCC MYA-4449 / AS 2.2408 / CBS 8840 / NBRC 1802 / NCYC 2889) TaxID=226230 RepID=J8TXG7_SACK1|nr:uncharacterized protein SKDI_05G1630 [Saccharomyces kudriavzevii IFO 1802]EJT44753.1 YER085C-like protein [Saccharomyces kudriavzevii IFO 1802]CAI4060348.1 hypothetical protein SKDI_05G1630 [Saccharomyces kudriavzevii IFO 1802]
MNFRGPLVNFLKSILNNINSAFLHGIKQLQLQLLRETNILKVMNRGIEKLFGQESKNGLLPRVTEEEKDVVCRIRPHDECSKFEVIELKAKEMQMYYEKMVFEMTQEFRGDKRVFSLINHFSKSHDLGRIDTEIVKVERDRRYGEREIQVIPIRFKPICLERRAQMTRGGKK